MPFNDNKNNIILLRQVSRAAIETIIITCKILKITLLITVHCDPFFLYEMSCICDRCLISAELRASKGTHAKPWPPADAGTSWLAHGVAF